MEKFDVFISYNWKSKPEVELLFKDLTEKLNLRVWLDRNEINGLLLYDTISAGIRRSNIFLCCITREYCTSKNCRMEIEYARYLKKEIVVLMLQKLNIEDIEGIGMIINPYSRINCYEFSDTWNDKCFEKISRAITESLKNKKNSKDQDNSISDHTETLYKATNIPAIILEQEGKDTFKEFIYGDRLDEIGWRDLNSIKSIDAQSEDLTISNNSFTTTSSIRISV